MDDFPDIQALPATGATFAVVGNINQSQLITKRIGPGELSNFDFQILKGRNALMASAGERVAGYSRLEQDANGTVLERAFVVGSPLNEIDVAGDLQKGVAIAIEIVK